MLIKYITRLKKALFQKIRFIIGVTFLLFLYVNATAPTGTFAQLMPKTQSAWQDLINAKQSFVMLNPNPTDNDWISFRSKPAIVKLVSVFRDNYVVELGNTKSGVKAIAIPGKTEIALDSDSSSGNSPFAELITSTKTELGSKVVYPILFDPINIFSNDSDNAYGYVAAGGIRTHLTWELMADCSVQSYCVVFTGKHELDHVRNELDRSHGVENVYHGSVNSGILTLMGLKSTVNPKSHVDDFDDGESYDKNGYNFTELGAHKVEATLASFVISKMLQDPATVIGDAKSIEAMEAFLTSFSRSMMMALAQIGVVADILGKLESNGVNLKINTDSGKTVSIEIPGEGSIELANYYINSKNELVTPKGVLTKKSDIDNAIRTQGILHCMQSLGRFFQDKKMLNKLAYQSERKIRDFAASSPPGLNDNARFYASYFSDTLIAIDNVVSQFEDKYSNDLKTVLNKPEIKKAINDFATADKESDKKSMSMQRGVLPGSATNKIPHQAHINDFVQTGSREHQSPLIANLIANSPLGNKLSEIYRDMPTNNGKTAVDYTYTQTNKLITDAGISLDNKQPLLVTNGSVILSYDYGWLTNSTNVNPDYIFDNTSYVSGLICPSCFSYKLKPIKNSTDSMALVSNTYEDFYNETQGGGNITLKQSINGIGRSISIGEIIGKNAAVFTEASLLNEEAKHGNLSQQELSDRLANLSEQNDSLIKLRQVLIDVKDGRLPAKIDTDPSALNALHLNTAVNSDITRMISSIDSSARGVYESIAAGSQGSGIPGAASVISVNPDLAGNGLAEAQKIEAETNKITTQKDIPLGNFPDQTSTETAYNKTVAAIIPNLPNVNSVNSSLNTVNNSNGCGNLDAKCYNNLVTVFNNVNNQVSQTLVSSSSVGAAAGVVKAPDSLAAAKQKLDNMYNLLANQIISENNKRDARNAAKIQQVKSDAERMYNSVIAGNWFPVLYLVNGVYIDPPCNASVCYKSGQGKMPKQLTYAELSAAQKYVENARAAYIASHTPVLEPRLSMISRSDGLATGNSSAYNEKVNSELQKIQQSIASNPRISIDEIVGSLKLAVPEFNKMAIENPAKAKSFVQSMITADPTGETLTATSNMFWTTVETPDYFYVITNPGATATYTVDNGLGGMCPVGF